MLHFYSKSDNPSSRHLEISFGRKTHELATERPRLTTTARMPLVSGSSKFFVTVEIGWRHASHVRLRRYAHGEQCRGHSCRTDVLA
jgi:hypothetical protein